MGQLMMEYPAGGVSFCCAVGNVGIGAWIHWRFSMVTEAPVYVGAFRGELMTQLFSMDGWQFAEAGVTVHLSVGFGHGHVQLISEYEDT
jgi:hypothetical protein